jgi:hypothetical protein
MKTPDLQEGARTRISWASTASHGNDREVAMGLHPHEPSEEP